MPLNSRYKSRILARLVEGQGGKCCYCRRAFTEDGQTQATLEHKKARMDGGKDNVANLAAACLHCNQHRGKQMVRDRLMAGCLLASSRDDETSGQLS